MLAISLTIACLRYIYNGVILHAHPVRGESHNQRNTTGEVGTLPSVVKPTARLSWISVVAIEKPMCAKLHTVAASNNRDHMP